jgi:hypothetical protein
MRLRFEARDLGGGSLVEAAVDDVRVSRFECVNARPADLNSDGAVDGVDLGLLLGAWGPGNGPADLDASGAVDGADLGIMLGDWGA